MTGLVGRQTSLDDQSRLKYARPDTRQDFSARVATGDWQILLPCAGVKMVRTKGAQRPAMPPWSLRRRASHDNKLDDDNALGAFEWDPCIAYGNRTSPCQLCPMCLPYAHDDFTHRFARHDSGGDGAEVWYQNAWTGQDKCLLVALQTKLEKGIAKAAVANGYRLHAKGTRTCTKFVHHSIQMQPTPPEFYANAIQTCPEFGQLSIHMQPKPSV